MFPKQLRAHLQNFSKNIPVSGTDREFFTDSITEFFGEQPVGGVEKVRWWR